MIQDLYPIFLRKSLRQVISFSVSIPFGFALPQSPTLLYHHPVLPQSPGWVGCCTVYTAYFRYHFYRIEYINREETFSRKIIKLCPAPIASALFFASSTISGSVPEKRTRHIPDASQKAIPNLMPGTVETRASWISSTVLIK